MASKLNYISDFYEEEILNGIVPELYINKEILTKENILSKEKYHKMYRINGDLFYEDERNQNDLQEFSLELNDQFEEFITQSIIYTTFEEFITQSIIYTTFEEFITQSIIYTTFEDDEDWIFEIKQDSYTVMVNSIILLSLYKWHTITDEHPSKCLVCDIIVQDRNNHIKTENHMINLEKHKPLKKFNLHITRLIGDQYHCAVCNEVYDKYNNTHYDSEKHLERMLYATNRATDSVSDFDISKDDHDSDKKTDIVSTSESGFDSDNFYDSNYFNNNKSTLRSVVKQTSTVTPTSFIEHVIDDKIYSIASDTYHMILRPNNLEFYCMLCILFDDVNNTSDHCESEEHLKKLEQCEIMTIHDEHFIRKVTTKFYHCGTCNNLQLSETVEAHLETHGKKQKTDKNLSNKTNKNNDKGNAQTNENKDRVKVQKSKINEIKDNENKINEHRNKENIQENKINEHRDKGNVQENKTNENRDKGNVQEHKTNEINKVSESNNHRPLSSQMLYYAPLREPSVNNRNPGIHNDIIINRFNCNIRVSFMSYNLILRRDVDFICLLCNYVSPDMTSHLRDVRHIVCLENFPFHPLFGVHLVRILHQDAHCAICNILVNAPMIHLHTLSQPHVFLFNKALNPINNANAMNQTSIGSIQSENTKQPTDVNIRNPPENLRAIATNNSETLNQASGTETAINQTVDLNQTELHSDNLENDIEDDMDIFNEFVYLKIKKTLVKVSYVSYHTLVHTGDGTRYCFICSYRITKSLRGHIKSKAHMNRMKKCKFISNYEKDTLRQVKMTYHCCICNVLVKKSDIKHHLLWPVHKENAFFVKLRKRAHLNNVINVEFQTKDTSCNEKEPQIQIVFKMISGKKTNDNIGGLVINIPPSEDYRGKIFNIPWDAWQGITRYDHGVNCNICHDFFADIDSHLEEDSHKKLVSTPIEKQYLPACIRKITETTLNCVTCNLTFSNKEKNISKHITGKKHLRNYEEILQTAFTDVS